MLNTEKKKDKRERKKKKKKKTEELNKNSPTMQDSVSVRVARHRQAGDGGLPAVLACSHPAIRRRLTPKILNLHKSVDYLMISDQIYQLLRYFGAKNSVGYTLFNHTITEIVLPFL
jgi:Ni,Fe-hydrogenase I large subunit